jgi:hypothetical protein
MNLSLEVNSDICSIDVFEINHIKAEYHDFGEKFDRNPETADDLGCGNMKFTGKRATPSVLLKYKITEADYDLIIERLESELSFGSCDLCS